jgi:Zn-dependent membrane protease YugP
VSSISPWLPVFALLHMPMFLNTMAYVIAMRVRSRFDRNIPDDLPITAGEWLREQLASISSVGGIVTDIDSSTDAYHTTDRIIELTDKTYFKSDPVFWAVAAHELGHAVFRRRHRWVDGVSIATMSVGRISSSLAMGLLAAFFLYANPSVRTACVTLFAVALASKAFGLVDEMYANWFAYRALQREDRLQPHHLRAVAWVLATSFLTYFAAVIGYAIVFWQSSRFFDAVGAGWFCNPVALTRLGSLVTIATSLALVVIATIQILVMIAPSKLLLAHKDTRSAALFAVVRILLWAVLMWMTWNLNSGADWQRSVSIAWMTEGQMAVRAVMFVATLPAMMGMSRLQKLWSPAFLDTDAYHASRREGLHLIATGNAFRVNIKGNLPVISSRLNAAFDLLMIPLLIDVLRSLL